MESWPALPYESWKETAQTLHLWTQIVGKIRLKTEPMINHWWNVTLYVTPRGLGTGTMPYGERSFRIEFDFLDHELTIDDSSGARVRFALEPMTVAAFYERIMRELRSIGIEIPIDRRPNEIANAIPFDQDTVHASYDRDAARRFWRVLLQANRLCTIFRSRFVGKASPAHFFWGSFDLAASRFSGRTAPPHPGGVPNMPDWVTREAYSREEHSVGFWPGGPGVDALFYAYAYPEPKGFSDARVAPAQAAWSPQMREFVLPYEAVRTSGDPDEAVLAFFQSTYDVAADLAAWDRSALER